MKKTISILVSAVLVAAMAVPGLETMAAGKDKMAAQAYGTEEQDISGGDVNGLDVSGGNLSAKNGLDREVSAGDVIGTRMELKSSYSVGATNEDGGVAEIVKYNKNNQKMYVVSGMLQSLDIVKVHEDGSTSLDKRILVGELGRENGFDAGDITSVDVNSDRDMIALAVQSSVYTEKGAIVVLDYDGNYITKFHAGIQPDMICFSPDGKYLLTANEGEPREGYGEGASDPEGSITIVTLEADVLQSTVKQCDFKSFDSKRDELLADKVLLKKNALPSLDLEPEYIAVTADSATAYVSLQENNAVAELDVASGAITSIKGLGFKNHNLDGNGLDLNKDGNINIQNENVYGVYMPDGLASAEIGGISYILTPNEGDAREWGDYTNLGSKAINQSKKKVEYLLNEETDGLDQDKTYLFGGRSFSIFRADTMELVWDSGADFEKITAELYPDYFNTTHKETELEGRSNKKGPEPEDIKVMTVGDRVYAYIGLERIGGIMMYDITNPKEPIFADYLNNRNFEESDISKAGDLGAEGICTVEARYSPFGYPCVLAANEISGTVSVIALKEGKYQEGGQSPDEPGTDNPDADEPGTDNPDADEPGTDNPDADEPGTDNPDTDEPGTDNPGNDGPVPEHPDTTVPDNSGAAFKPIQADWKAVEEAVLGKVKEAGNKIENTKGKNEILNFVTGKQTMVPENILKMVQGLPITLAFHTNEKLTFSIIGSQLPKAAKTTGSVDLTVEQGDFIIPVSVTAQKAAGVLDSRQLSLKYNGKFAIALNMHLAMGKENAGLYANLYFFNKQSGVLEPKASCQITKEGQAMFALPEGGSYLITVTNSK